MKKTTRISIVLILILVLILAMITTAAAGPGGSDVYVNNTLLSITTPYWKNGNAPASASDWNAHFDSATNTLTLKNAVIDTIYNTINGDFLVRSFDDLILVLEGTNTLRRSGAYTGATYGINSGGDLTIRGSGTLDILLKDSTTHATVTGINTTGNLTMQSGKSILAIESGEEAFAVTCMGTLLFSGGQMTIETKGERAYSVFEAYGFRMTGGSIAATSESTATDAAGMAGSAVALEGGEGIFKAFGAGKAIGLLFQDPITVSGGHFVFAGNSSGLDYFDTSEPVYNITGLSVYTSQDISGSGKKLWTSSAVDGLLSSYTGAGSPFRYVEFGIMSKVAAPQTGDSARPLQWVYMMGCSLLLAMTAVKARRRTGTGACR